MALACRRASPRLSERIAITSPSFTTESSRTLSSLMTQSERAVSIHIPVGFGAPGEERVGGLRGSLFRP